MKKEKLLKLIEYIKKNDLIEKYNDVYKEYDEKKEIENPGFRLEDLYSLTDEEVDLILLCKSDVEALFKFRMNSICYKELIKCEVKINDTLVLETVEDFRNFIDYDEYDKDKRIIRYIIKQEKSGIEKIVLFLSKMIHKNELSDTKLSIEVLCHYLSCISESKTYKGAVIIATLASSSRERNDCGIHELSKYPDHNLKIIEKISECNKNFQADYINSLLREKVNGISINPILLNNIEFIDNKLRLIEVFTKSESEEACNIMYRIIKENVEMLRNNPNRVISMLVECANLKSDEDYVNITTITEIKELEEILYKLDDEIEIDECVRVKVKKKKRK